MHCNEKDNKKLPVEISTVQRPCMAIFSISYAAELGRDAGSMYGVLSLSMA